GSPAGYGEFFDINRITITNLVQVDDDDFTLDDTLNTALWSPAFSLDAAKTGNAGSVFQVSTNTPFWVTWTVPDDSFVLATSTSLTNASSLWLSPTYFGFGAPVTMTVPTKMGTALKWTLIPTAAFPTVDGSIGGQPSPTGFFQLQNPGPAQY